MRAHLFGRLRAGVPAISQGHGTLQRCLTMPPDPDGRMRLLHGPGGEAKVTKVIKFAGKLWGALRPERFEHANHFVSAPPPRGKRHAKGGELLPPPADAHATD